MKSILDKWKRIFKRQKKSRLLNEDVDYDPDSREIAQSRAQTPLRRRSKSVPKLDTMDQDSTHEPNIFIRPHDFDYDSFVVPKVRVKPARNNTPKKVNKAQRRVSVHEIPKTGMFKFARLSDIPENYHQLRNCVTNVELLDTIPHSKSSQAKLNSSLEKPKNKASNQSLATKTSTATIFSSISMLDLSYMTESSGIVEKFELSPSIVRKFQSSNELPKERRPSLVSNDDGVVI